MNRIVLRAALAALALTAFAAAAPADEDDDYESGNSRFQQIREFFNCANTPAAHFDGTIVDAALATPALEQLAQAVVAAGLVELLSGEGPFTVYAPINEAFESIPAGVLNGIVSETDDQANPIVLQTILGYHVVPGLRFRNDPRRVFNRITQVQTSIGQSVFFSRDWDGTEINQSNLVSCQPVRTANGIVFLIDSVLLPQFPTGH